MSLNLERLHIYVESIPSFSRDWKLIKIEWELFEQAELINQSFQVEVREDETGEEIETVEVTEVRGGRKTVKKRDGDIVKMFVEKLEEVAALIGSVKSLHLVNDIFGACDCPSKVLKLQHYRDRIVEALQKSSKINNLKLDELSVHTCSSQCDLMLFDWPSLKVTDESMNRSTSSWAFDELVDKKRMQIHVENMRASDLMLLIQIYISKPVIKNTEFFIYHVYSHPDIELILEYFDFPPENEPFRRQKRNSKLLHTQRIPLDDRHIFVVMISENAVSGTVVLLDRVKKESSRLIRRHSWKRKTAAIWPFFAVKTFYD